MSHRTGVVAGLLIAVVLAGCQTTTGRTAGTVIDDSTTTATVKSKLVADRPSNLTAVGVDTVKGVTYLTGVVDTPDQRLRAEQLAWSVSGVRQVVNNIQVRQPAAASPAASTTTTVPAASPRRALVGTIENVDTARSQVTVTAGNDQLLLQLPPEVVRDLRPGDQISLDVTVRPAR